MQSRFIQQAGLTAALISGFSFTCYADVVESMDPVIVTATRSAQPLSQTLADVLIINAADIAASGKQNLAELLQAQGGAEMATNGGAGQVSALFLRGTNSNHVLVLIDGVRVNSATSGTNALEHIPLDQIERIEIVRGPASSLYGADAIGGVVQIFTRRGAENFSTSVTLGSYNAQKYSAAYGTQWGNTRAHVQVGYSTSEGFSATNDRNVFSFNPDRDGNQNKNISVSLSQQYSPQQSIGLSLLRTHAITHFDSGPASDDLNRQTLSTYLIDFNNKFTSGWQSKLQFARSLDDLNTSGVFASLFATTQNQLLWQNNVKVDGGDVVFGFDSVRQRVNSDTAFTEIARTINGAYAGVNGKSGSQDFHISLRRDHTAQFGSHETGSVAYGFHFTPAWRARVNVGNAFKAPSFNDLYYPEQFGFKGNPALKPERSRSAEAALEYRANHVTLRLTHFRSRLDDLITIDPSFSTVENLAHARINGTTLHYSQGFGGLALRGDITTQNPEDAATGHQLIRRAKHFGSAGVTHSVGTWNVGVDVVASGARFDSASNEAATRMGGYGLVNLHSVKKLTPNINLSLHLNNVLDKKYALAQGYNTSGREVWATIGWQPY